MPSIWGAAPILAAVGLVAGCYATAPRRVVIAAPAWSRDCTETVAGVFTRAGYVPMPTPQGYTAFYAAREGSNQLRRERVARGIGILVTRDAEGCRVVLEALSTDGACLDEEAYWCGLPDPRVGPTFMPCPLWQSFCEMTPTPAIERDTSFDDLARKVRVALGAEPRVD
jgi:hypothetical protein